MTNQATRTYDRAPLNAVEAIAHTLTYPQWREAVVKAYAEVRNITQARAREVGPIEPIKHRDLCIKHVAAGGTLESKVLDSLGDAGRYRVFHDYPDYAKRHRETYGAAYANPDARKLDRYGRPKES